MQATDIFARHIVGPFRPYGPGAPFYYESAESKAGNVRTHYRALRARGTPAGKAFRRALQLPATYLPGYSEGYRNPRVPAMGAPWEAGSTRLRWADDTSRVGLRFIGWADELARLGHTGWFNRDDCESSTLRGGVWQLPGRNGEALLVPGYAEFEGGREMNPGSAALALWDIQRAPMTGDDSGCDRLTESDELRDAARLADDIAESVAEDERDNDSAYQAGARAAREVLEALEERNGEGRALLADLRAKRRAGVDEGAPGATMLRVARRALGSILEALETARAARLEAWTACPWALESAWRDGYAEESGADGWNRFARLQTLSAIGPGSGPALLPESGK